MLRNAYNSDGYQFKNINKTNIYLSANLYFKTIYWISIVKLFTVVDYHV